MNLKTAIITMKEKATDKYAQSYLNSIPKAIDEGGTHGLCVHLQYILSNLRTWRGDEAKSIKEFIKQWITDNDKVNNE